MAFDFSDLSLEELSAVSGRLCAPGVPPKNRKEAKDHLAQIHKLQVHERQLLAKEAAVAKQKRDEWVKVTTEWQQVVESFEELKDKKSTKKLWATFGIAPQVRCKVWELTIGNPRHITSRMYELCVKKALERERLEPLQSKNEQVNPSADFDPAFFSPRSSKYETAALIGVDLPRTIICSRQSNNSDSPAQSPVAEPTSPRSRRAMEHPCSLAQSSLLISNLDDAHMLSKLNLVLRAFVEFRPDVGYVQGMSYLAAMLLMHMEEQRAFVCLATLITIGHFPYFYTVNHIGMSAHISVFEEVLERGCPALARYFAVIGARPQMYVIDWWMSLFSRTLPFDIAAKCWDLYLLDTGYLYRLSMCILLYFEPNFHEEAELDEVMAFFSREQRQLMDEEKYFALVTDQDRYPPDISTIHTIMDKHLNSLRPPADEFEL